MFKIYDNWYTTCDRNSSKYVIVCSIQESRKVVRDYPTLERVFS